MYTNGFSSRVKFDLKQNGFKLKDLASELNIPAQNLYKILNNNTIRLKTMIAINRAMLSLCNITYSIEDFADILGEY